LNGASRVRKDEGNMRQTWKAVSSRSNHQVITGDVTLQYQENTELIFFTYLDDVELMIIVVTSTLSDSLKEMEPYAFGLMEMVESNASTMPALAKQAWKGVMSMQTSVDGGSASARRILWMCSRAPASL
jgi:hypothetical protein